MRRRGLHLKIPALRDRKSDIAMLALHFFHSMRADLGRAELEGFSPEALSMLETPTWPGQHPRAAERRGARGANARSSKW